MSSYLITWNPNKWQWDTLTDDIGYYLSHGYHDGSWSCGVNKQITTGDRLFLLRQGREPRGIIGSGYAISNVYEGDHWDKNHHSGIARYISIRFDVILDAEREPVFRREWLDASQYADTHWNTQVSGIRILSHVAETLEIEWARFLASRNIVQEYTIRQSIQLPEEITQDQTFLEGAVENVIVNRYERNTLARRACIHYYGLKCSVCHFDFQAFYGDIGIGFIHVHHLIPISEIGSTYEIDPIRDLRPVCPNCHAMIHKNTPPYTISEVQEIIAKHRQR